MSDATSEGPRLHEQTAKVVLVTGAGSGIGWAITRRLVDEGHYVYAGARKEAHLRALGAVRNVRPLRLDITNPNDISAAVEVVRSEAQSLYGLVNNAGIATLGPVIDGDIDEVALTMNVNVLGTYRVTQAFAPLVLAARGRIVTIGSVSGILAARNVSAYSMSKHAIEAFTDSLAAELAQAGVHVSVIEPGVFNTSLVKNAVGRTGRDMSRDLTNSPPPDAVASAASLALFEPVPKRRYLVVSSCEEARATLGKQLEQLVQLNARHRYTLGRTALMEMLDHHLENDAG